MTYKLFPIFFIILLNINCQGRTQHAYEMDKSAAHRKEALPLAAPQPEWIKDPSSLLPELLFVTAVGTGNNYQASDDQALHEMASQFRVKLKGVNVHVSSRAIESSGDGDRPVVFVHSDTTSGVRTEVNLQLDGVIIKKRWTDNVNNTYYSLAVLERAPVIEKLTGQIEQTQSSILELQNDGDRFESEKRTIRATKIFLRASEKRKNLNPLIEAYQFVKNDFSPFLLNSEILSPLKLENRAERIISQVDIVAVSGDGQRTRAGEPLPEPLVVKVIYRGEQTVPVKGVPLIFQYQSGGGEMGKGKITDQNGIASNKIYAVKETKEKNHLISVNLDTKAIFSDAYMDHPLIKQLDSKKRLFSYTLQKPKGWEAGILSLAQQLIYRLDVNQRLKVEKVDFRDLRSRKRMPFSELVERDLRRHLGTISKVSVVVAKAQTGDMKTRDLSFAQEPTAPEDSLGVEITGFYKKIPRNQGVRIYASLIDSKSLSMGEGMVEIKSGDIDEKDFELINEIKPLPETQTDDRYKLTIEWLLALKQENPEFNFKMWTDKEEYKICGTEACDKVNIFVQSERSGYLYLFDIGTSGNLWMLFPNEKMRKSNFIEAGRVIKIPDHYWGTPIWVHEPEGLERIKAILTPEPVDWGALDKTSAGFKRLIRGNERGLQDLSLTMNQLYPDMAEATTSFFIRKQGDKSMLGTRSIKTPPPKKPMDIIGTVGRGEEKPVGRRQ